MSIEPFKIGEVAAMLDTTVRTIRYYEEEGLLLPHRTDGGTRLYSNQHIGRLKAIMHLADNGFSLDTIRLIGTVRTTCATGDEGSRKVAGTIDHAIKDIEEQIDNLKELKSELRAAYGMIKKCAGCKNEPSSRGCPICPVNNNLSKIEVLNLIWE